MNLYIITAKDPDDLECDYDLVVSAETPQDAVEFWQNWYNFGWDEEEQIGLFRGGVIAPDTDKIALHPHFVDLARIWQITRTGVPGVLVWGQSQMKLVGYVEL